MIQLQIVYSVAALLVLPGQLLFYLGIFSRRVFLKTLENSLPTPLLCIVLFENFDCNIILAVSLLTL